MKWKLEKVDDIFWIVSTDGERLECGHSSLVANHALVTLNMGVAEVEKERVNLNPFPKGRWSN